MGFTALIAGGLGAAGSIGGALIGANASQNASNQQVQAQMAALAQQKQLFNQGLTQQLGLFNQGLGVQSGYVGQAQKTLNPFIQAGQGASNTLSSLLTPGQSAASLANMPGFQFASQYGTMAANNATVAKTGPSSGPLATAISQYTQGLAGNQYFNTVNALQGFTNTGANAATNLGGIFGGAGNAALGAGANVGGNILSGAIGSGNAQASTLGNIGNAQAAGTLGSANAISGGLTGAAGAGSNALLLSALGGGGAGGNNGIYGYYQGYSNPGQFNNVPATSLTDAQAAGYGAANGLVP